MSTPSTAVATLPPPHHQYYPRHQAYPAPPTSYTNGLQSTLVNGTPRLNPQQYQPYDQLTSSSSDQRRPHITANPRPTQPQLPPIQPPPSQVAHPTAMTTRSRRSARQPDWNEFFKNGVPREVIVIDDSPPPPNPQPEQHGYDRHTDKRRKMGPSTTYDPVYRPQPTYSSTLTPYRDNNSSANQTVSTDKTAPVYNDSMSIAPSMAAPYQSHSTGQTATGQKRKRGTRADELKTAKRREVERPASPFTAYVPPPQPIIKAREVHVEIIPDVRIHVL